MGLAQDEQTPLYVACRDGKGEVVKLLLADERMDVNRADKVRVGEGRAVVGGEREEGAVQSVVLVRAEGGRSSQQQGGGCEGWACVHCFGVRGLMGMEAWEREDGGAGGGGGKEGGCGAGVMGGDDGALVTT